METVTVSAPGKLMLFGEHAVIYDYPCIVTAVDERIKASVTVLDNDQVEIRVPSLLEPFTTGIEDLLTRDELPKEVNFVAVSLKKFWNHVGETFGVSIETKSEFSHSYGLGSSSAVTAATIKALSHATNRDLDLDRIFQLSYQTVLDVQKGVGSGFDVAAATYGGTIYFVNGGKVIRPITISELPLIICYSGVKASTVEYVRKVAALRVRYPELTGSIMGMIESIVTEAEVALRESNYKLAGELMNFNQGLLHSLGVSTLRLDVLINALRDNGAYGAKLSGAGGGDYIIGFVSNETKAEVENGIKDVIQKYDLTNAGIVSVKAGAEGVRVERG